MLVMGSLVAFMVARADTFELSDGQTLTGDVVSFDENGLIVRTPDGKYSERTPWTKFSQADLKKLGQNRKIAPLVEPFIEVSQEERIRKTEVEIKPVPRLERPARQSLAGAMFSSSVGLFTLFLIYAANLYAAYEVSIFRAQPRVLVCGLAAIPLIGIVSPIVFLCLPTRMERSRQPELPAEVVAAASQTFTVPGAQSSQAATAGNLRISQATSGHATGSLPTTQVFQRGAFTFNRRFFETKFAGFFAMIRRDPEKDMVLLVKTGRGEFVGQRITRIAASDLHLNVQRGTATEEVRVPFTEIQEVQLKHKDA